MAKKDKFQKLLDKTYRYLSHRPRSEKEIRNYLKKKKASPAAVAKIFAVLKEQKLVDDVAFAVWWVEQRATFRPRGKMGLRAELRQKGIESGLIEEVVGSVDELPLARQVFNKKQKTYQRLGKREYQRKMSAALSRRGFSWSTIKTVLDSAGTKSDN